MYRQVFTVPSRWIMERDFTISMRKKARISEIALILRNRLESTNPAQSCNLALYISAPRSAPGESKYMNILHYSDSLSSHIVSQIYKPYNATVNNNNMKTTTVAAAACPVLLGTGAAAYTLQWDVNSSNFLDYFVFDTVSD